MKGYGHRIIAKQLSVGDTRLPPSIGLSIAFVLSIGLWAIILSFLA
ncbi:MAG: hypothetical protein ACOY45_08725 [Pseudomonadota bacterium]